MRGLAASWPRLPRRLHVNLVAAAAPTVHFHMQTAAAWECAPGLLLYFVEDFSILLKVAVRLLGLAVMRVKQRVALA